MHISSTKSDWVVSTLYDLADAVGWADAEATLNERATLKLLSPAEAPRERAELLLKQSEEGPTDTSLALAKRAFRARPRLPAGSGAVRQAAAGARKTWPGRGGH